MPPPRAVGSLAPAALDASRFRRRASRPSRSPRDADRRLPRRRRAVSSDASADDAAPSSSSSLSPLLDNVCFVLCRPQGPQNIGAIARVMNNFGVTDLRIVTPEASALAPPFDARARRGRSPPTTPRRRAPPPPRGRGARLRRPRGLAPPRRQALRDRGRSPGGRRLRRRHHRAAAREPPRGGRPRSRKTHRRRRETRPRRGGVWQRGDGPDQRRASAREPRGDDPDRGPRGDARERSEALEAEVHRRRGADQSQPLARRRRPRVRAALAVSRRRGSGVRIRARHRRRAEAPRGGTRERPVRDGGPEAEEATAGRRERRRGGGRT